MRRLNAWTVAVGAALWLMVIGAGSLPAASLKPDDCLACHESGDPQVDRKAFENSIHGSLDCVDCHKDVKEIPHPEKLKPVDCAACHTDIVKEYTGSVHGAARQKGNLGAARCVDCHGMHNILPKSDPASWVNRFKLPDTCGKCHENDQFAQSHHLASAEFVRKYRGSIHGRGLYRSGLAVTAVCSDCHGIHNIQSKEHSDSRVARANVPDTCNRCHVGIFNDYIQSAHGQLWKKGNQKVPVCTNCHNSHEIQDPFGSPFQMQSASSCGNCHTDKAPSYRDSFHGQASSLGFVFAARCSDCHTPHMNLPASDPRSSVAPANLVKTCGKCHAGSNANFVKYDPHADPHNKDKSPLFYYTFIFMNVLLIGTFSFFGVHGLLWLQRSVVASMRGEFHRKWEEGQWVQRFDPVQRIIHLTVVISFLGLAATGLPLKFNDTGWGHWVGALLGGVEPSRYLHRLFAIVTIGYFLFHLLMLGHQIVRKKQYHFLFGPDSMLPRPKDLVDFWHNLRWFFYQGPPPKLDRFTYWEKFDYFAVFWGVPVIGLSGLMLWFPTFFARFVPGNWLNVAMIVHADEALLAVGFIFTFHFFHTHLRPESFPMDLVIFTGKVPLEKFREERPEEYQRLVREGKLESIIVESPSPALIKACRIFGFTALAIGVYLIVMIYLSLLAGK
jgi:cytochrome b subunit of formate dehydrogenase/nitrate/TMAO reductase-like tetraheme cytochrome c subunit